MEKYGIDEGAGDKDLEKVAAEGCPKCGSEKVQRHGNTLICDNCGTSPWEQEKKK